MGITRLLLNGFAANFSQGLKQILTSVLCFTATINTLYKGDTDIVIRDKTAEINLSQLKNFQLHRYTLPVEFF